MIWIRAKIPMEVSILCYVSGCNKGCKPRDSLIYTPCLRREVSELNSATPCIVTFYTFQTFLCSHIVATREYLERTHRYRC